jgi:predicted RNase H-like nuclease (RuvC/YqgF family)
MDHDIRAAVEKRWSPEEKQRMAEIQSRADRESRTSRETSDVAQAIENLTTLVMELFARVEELEDRLLDKEGF